MGYESLSNVIPPPIHLAKVIASRVGVDLDDVTPDCFLVDELVDGFKNQWRNLPRPYIVVQRRAGPWTINKNWPDKYWEILIQSLSKSATLIEIGDSPQSHLDTGRDHYIDLRRKTTLTELIACVAASDILIAPVSGPIHIAAAVQTPAVVIVGGFEHPQNTAYSGNRIFHASISCAPCWLTTPCPIERECLKQISPETVERAVIELWNNRPVSSESG
jgi:ADP-heptose:LPS heptosyltransferase